MNALTLEVILRVVFGVTDERAARPSSGRGSTGPSTSAPRILLGWGWPGAAALRPLEGARSRTPARARPAHLRRDRASAARRPTSPSATDVLSRLIRVEDGGDRLSDEELRDQLVTLLLAGHETTATALAWALYEVGRDPRAAATGPATRPGDGDDDVAGGRAQGVDAAAPGHPHGGAHADAAPATIGGYDLPAGAPSARRSCSTHARAENHPEPDGLPARALPRPRTPPTNTWIPFGGGVRRCIGAGFSLMEGVAVLREVFADVDVARRSPTTSPRSATSPASRAAVPGSGSPLR